MTETIVLGLVIFALIAFIAWREYLYQSQIKMLVRAVKASTLGEMLYAEKAGQEDTESVEPDLVPLETADHATWIRYLHTSQEQEDEVESVK